MSGWERRTLGSLPVDADRTLNWLPGFVQGFTTRQGGVSKVPYSSFNLGDHVGDETGSVLANRNILCESLGFAPERIALAEQVHGSDVAEVTEGGRYLGCDALVTNVPGLLLVLFFADCVPVYLVDPRDRVVALVHAGWRGTHGRIVAGTVRYLHERYGIKPKSLIASIGPSIAAVNYEVGLDVADRFRSLNLSGSATAVMPSSPFSGKYLLNLRLVLYAQLLEAGIPPHSISVSEADTYRQSADFFSYRRDGAKTGRMAAYLGMV